ncbi:MAG TPA: GFA family protein [Candidatus Udaeobacter sp.]|nr:GFA family protein [Candidatus Udaeobacter sp.]
MKRTYTGSCHCGAVRYEADIDLAQGTSKCNCTFCMKTRSWKAFVKPSSFRVLSGSDNIKGYHKHPLAPLKYFCDVCGVRTHEVGSADYMGGDFVGIFIATLDNAEPEELITAPVRYADGRHNNWQNPPAETRHL